MTPSKDKLPESINGNMTEHTECFKLEVNTDEEAENWINLYSQENRCKFLVKTAKSLDKLDNLSEVLRLIQYRCVVPNCDMTITLLFMNEGHEMKYRLEFCGNHKFEKCTQILRPFDVNLLSYTTRELYWEDYQPVRSYKYTNASGPVIYDIETHDKNEVLRWLRYYQIEEGVSLKLRENEEDSQCTLVASCVMNKCPFRIKLKCLANFYRAVEMEKHSHKVKSNSNDGIIISMPQTSSDKENSDNEAARNGLTGLISKKLQLLADKAQISDPNAEMTQNFKAEIEDDEEILPDAKDYRSEMEMICDRTNSDYFVIDHLQMYLFTTHMMRQAAAHSCSRIMIYIGTTKTEIAYGFYLTIISTKLPSGVYPILMAFHTEDSVDQYITLLNAILSKYPMYFGGAKYPHYVMMDGNFAGFGAVEAVFKNSKIFICPRLTLTTLKSIASNIHDTKLRSQYNDLTSKIIANPDRVESDRALYSLLHGPTGSLPQVKEFMDIIDGYPGQVRICDRVGLGIGDRHTNNITLVMLNMMTSQVLEGQNFYTVDGAIYWILKDLDLKLFSKFVQHVQAMARNVSKVYINELHTVKSHKQVDAEAFELDLTDGSSLRVHTNQHSCPCVTALKAQMCGHLLYLVRLGLYKPDVMQPLVCKEQLLEEEVLFLRQRFSPQERRQKPRMEAIEVKPDWRPELRPSVTFSALVHDNKFFTTQIVRELVDVLNRLPMEELRTRLLGSAKVIQMLSSHNNKIQGELDSPSKSHIEGERVSRCHLADFYQHDDNRLNEYEEYDEDHLPDEEAEDFDEDWNVSHRKRGPSTGRMSSASLGVPQRKRKRELVKDFDGLPHHHLPGPSSNQQQNHLIDDVVDEEHSPSYAGPEEEEWSDRLNDVSALISETGPSRNRKANTNVPTESHNQNFSVINDGEFIDIHDYADNTTNSLQKIKDRPKIQPIPFQKRILAQQQEQTVDLKSQSKPFLDLDDETVLRSTINELRD